MRSTPGFADETHAPWFEELEKGQLFADAPAVTLSTGLAAQHQAILGDRLRLALDAELATTVTGQSGPLAHPGLVCDVAIGQSTEVTQRVIGNLFYRGLAFHRLPLIGDTLRTTTEVVGLRQNKPRAGRPASGLVALRIRTTDGQGRSVLDFHRCAMLPLGNSGASSGAIDDMSAIGDAADPRLAATALAGWDLDHYRTALGGPHFADLEPGQRWTVAGADVVSSAPELARLTLNVAFAHHDSAAGRDQRRLVYGGHTIGLASAQLCRALPNLLTIVGWESCDHLGPVFEGDTLASTIELEGAAPFPAGGGLLRLRSRVRARDQHGKGERDVLDWRLLGAMA